MFKIGDFSRLSQVSIKALRHYDELGLLRPAQIDPESGYRYYGLEQLPRLNSILALKDLGLSLDQIAILLDKELSVGELRAMLTLKQAELRQRVQDEQGRLARVEARINQIEQENKMPDYEVVIRSVEPVKVLSLREVAHGIDAIGALYAETYGAMHKQGVAEAAACFSIFYDEGFDAENFDIEVAYPVAETVKGPIALEGGRKLAVREIPGAEMAASTIHRGGYEGLGAVYSTLMRWIEANGYEADGAPRETYLRGGGGPDAVTEVLFPVKKK